MSNTAGALQTLAVYREQFHGGVLSREADVAELTASLALGREERALSLLDGLAGADFAGVSQAKELRLLRGELLGRRGRRDEALTVFAGLLEEGLSPAQRERALFGRATCLLQQGNAEASRSVLTRYLDEFPQGRFAAEAQRALSASARKVLGPAAIHLRRHF